jgi:signal transduction histidine kinase/ligand-binding sensor domain-containing protein
VRSQEGLFFRAPRTTLPILALCLLWPTGSQASAASVPAIDVIDLYHTAWGGKEGAPSGVQAMAQTKDGLLWLGAHNGLYNFDGVRFSSVRRVDSTKLPSGEVYALLATRAGGLWVSYLFGGASFIKDGKAANYSRSDGLPQGTITSLAEGSDGEVWAASTGGLFRWTQGRWEDITEQYGLPTRFLRSICIDPDRTVWINTGGNIFFLRSGSYRFEASPWRIDSVNNPVIARSREGVPWISTHIGGRPAALRLSVQSLDKPSPEDMVWLDKPDAAVDVVERAGALWIDSGTSLARVTPGAQSPHDAAIVDPVNGYPLDHASGSAVQAGFEDQEGDIWLGTTGGIDKFRNSRIHRLPRIIGEITIVAADGGGLWVGLDRSPAIPRGLYRVTSDSSPLRVPGVERVSAGYRNPRGSAWVGGAAGLWHFEHGEWRFVAGPESLRGQADTDLQTLAEDAGGDLWISVVRSGLFERISGAWTPYTPQNIAPGEYPLIMATDQAGTLWLGYARNRLVALADRGERIFSAADGVAAGNVLALAVVHGKLWAGGDQGLAQFDGHRFVPVNIAGGSPVTGISGMLQSDGGDAWLNTGAGVIHVLSSDLDAWSQHQDQPLKAEWLDYLDGMLGSPTPVRPLPTVLEGTDGRIWFTTTNGIFWSDPGPGPRNPIAPSVLVTGVIADGIAFDPSRTVVLGKNVRNLEIDYTAPSLPIPERVRFKYRLVGRDSGWQDVGTRRSAFYTDLRPGRYEFRVIASNNDGVWNEAGRQLTLVLPPNTFQTFWFRSLCSAAAAGLLVILFVLRLRQMNLRLLRLLAQRFDARVDERTRIARDFHDSLLQGFQGLMFRLQAVRQLLPARADEAASQLDLALETGDKAIEEGRDAVRDLREFNPIQGDLSEALAAFGEEFAAIQGSERRNYRVLVEGGPRTLDPLLRDEVYRVAREAIRNAFKHARAANIEADLIYGSTHFSVRVRDDGMGIDPHVLARGRRDGHWGLPGMRERAAAFKGELNVWSHAGAGTEIELKIPAAVAYVRSTRLWRLPRRGSRGKVAPVNPP